MPHLHKVKPLADWKGAKAFTGLRNYNAIYFLKNGDVNSISLPDKHKKNIGMVF